MKRLLNLCAIVTVSLTLCAGLFFIHEYMNLRIKIVNFSVKTASADEVPELDENWLTLHRRQSFPGLIINPSPEGDLVFIEGRVRLRKEGILPAEWIALEVKPMNGDVMILPDTKASVLKAGEEGDLTVHILCSREVKETIRELVLSYYILGKRMTMDLLMDEVSVKLEEKL